MNSKKIRNWSLLAVAGLFLIYVAWVVRFEINLGYNQPQGGSTLVLATFNEEGERHERVLRLEQIGGQNYISVNHWPRNWYWQALNEPNVEVKLPGEDSFAPYLAVPLEGAEEQRISEIYTFDFNFRFQTGFPPRRFLRLDPRG